MHACAPGRVSQIPDGQVQAPTAINFYKIFNNISLIVCCVVEAGGFCDFTISRFNDLGPLSVSPY